MLKLLKYEWKACARTCLPLYGVLILMSLISRILYVIPKNASLDFMLPAIGSMLYMGVMMAAFVVTAVILIQRFYKNLLGSEGYLMFTLPVTVSQHLLSKTIIAVVMIGLSGLSALISIFIFADRMILSMDEVWQAFTGLSTLWYVVLSTALQVLLLMVMMGAGNAVPEPFVDLMKVWWSGITPMGAAHLMLRFCCVFTLLSDAVYFLVTRWILVHKLNLE